MTPAGQLAEGFVQLILLIRQVHELVLWRESWHELRQQWIISYHIAEKHWTFAQHLIATIFCGPWWWFVVCPVLTWKSSWIRDWCKLDLVSATMYCTIHLQIGSFEKMFCMDAFSKLVWVDGVLWHICSSRAHWGHIWHIWFRVWSSGQGIG